jgi:hypothetical protein
MKTVEIKATLTDAQAWEFAQFLKRVCFSDYRQHATSEAEAYRMVEAGERIRGGAGGCRLCAPVAPPSEKP